MDINNSTNITNQIAASISKINLNTAKRNYEAPKEETEINSSTKEDDIKLMDKKETLRAQNKIDVEDIQKYANYMGENLSIDDINYGLMYGRSVIADYCV